MFKALLSSTASSPLQLKDIHLLEVREWYDLGLQLGVSEYDLDTIEKNNPRDNGGCKRNMFSKWLQVDTNANVRKLEQACRKIGETKIADELCSQHGISQGENGNQSNQGMSVH